MSAKHAFLGCMLDFQHKHTEKLCFPTYAMRLFYLEDFILTNDQDL